MRHGVPEDCRSGCRDHAPPHAGLVLHAVRLQVSSTEILEYSACATLDFVKIGVSLSGELLNFADAEAKRRGLTRSAFLAELLRAERIREQTRAYLDRYGWDVAEDEAGWREYQAQRMAREYGDDEW